MTAYDDTALAAQAFWPHQWVQDTRWPLFRLSLGGETEYALHLMSISTWLELIVVIVGQACVAALFSLAVYHTLVKKSVSSTIRLGVQSFNYNY